MKNLLIDCQTLHTPDRNRGIGRYLLSLLPQLMTDAPELRILCCMTRRPNQWKMPSVMADSAVLRVLKLGNEGLPIPQQELLYRNALEDLIAAEGIDVYWNPNCLMPNVLFPGILMGCTNVATIHDVIPLVMPDPYLTASPADQFEDYVARLLALERYDAIVTPSQCSLQDLLAHTRIQPDRVHVIPEGVSDGFFDRIPSGDLDEIRHRYGLSTSVVFSLVGSDFRKNTDRLLESFRQLTRQGVAPGQLVLGGGFDPVERQRLAHWLRVNRLEDRVVFTGRVPDEDLAGLYRLSRLFIFPSLYEGFWAAGFGGNGFRIPGCILQKCIPAGGCRSCGRLFRSRGLCRHERRDWKGVGIRPQACRNDPRGTAACRSISLAGHRHGNLGCAHQGGFQSGPGAESTRGLSITAAVAFASQEAALGIFHPTEPPTIWDRRLLRGTPAAYRCRGRHRSVRRRPASIRSAYHRGP
jgi:glycosyltransferase involved in cell wall biosynthesis